MVALKNRTESEELRIFANALRNMLDQEPLYKDPTRKKGQRTNTERFDVALYTLPRSSHARRFYHPDPAQFYEP